MSNRLFLVHHLNNIFFKYIISTIIVMVIHRLPSASFWLLWWWLKPMTMVLSKHLFPLMLMTRMFKCLRLLPIVWSGRSGISGGEATITTPALSITIDGLIITMEDITRQRRGIWSQNNNKELHIQINDIIGDLLITPMAIITPIPTIITQLGNLKYTRPLFNI